MHAHAHAQTDRVREKDQHLGANIRACDILSLMLYSVAARNTSSHTKDISTANKMDVRRGRERSDSYDQATVTK